MANVSGFEGVAWMIGGGARHSADIGRLVAFAATGGGEGVIEPRDCKVSATAGTANNQVHIAPGAIVIRNRSANAFSQSYVVRATTASHLDVPPSGSGGANYLVVVRVEDSQFPPWQPKADPVNGPYVIPTLIACPAGTTSARQLGLPQSMYAVARIDLPPNTSAVEQFMIKPLRRLAQARSHRAIEQANPTPEDFMGTSTGRIWPNYRPQIYVPEWVTGAVATATLSSIGLRNGSTQGVMTLVLAGPATGVGGLRANDIGYDLDAPSQGGSRHTLVVAGGWNDITALAGGTYEIRLEARNTNTGQDTGDLVTVQGTQVQYDIQFFESILE